MKFHALILAYTIIPLVLVHAEPIILQATPFINSQNSQFGPAIEGASVNKLGEAFATNFGSQSFQFGHITPEQKLFHASLSKTAFFNGVRFLPLSKYEIDNGIKSVALVADKVDSEISKVTEMIDGTTKQETFCKDNSFVYPNDLTLSNSGRIYISGQNITETTKIGDGGLWICYPDGIAKQLLSLGRTNGIELSPDEKTLYLSEIFNQESKPVSNKIWKFNVDPSTGDISSQELFVDFEQLDGTQTITIDGMRTDIQGNLYATRNGGQEIVKFSPDKIVLARIKLNIMKPTNLEFAGEKGQTMFIVGRCLDDGTKGCVDTIENDVPGKMFTFLNQY